MATCKECGYDQLAENARFCSNCGARISEPQTPLSSPVKNGPQTLVQVDLQVEKIASGGRAVGTEVDRVEGSMTVVQGNLNFLNRQNYSFPPDHGARLVTMILEDAALTAEWKQELEEKFNIPAVIVRSGTVSSLERELPSQDVSIFQYFPYMVISWRSTFSEEHLPHLVGTVPAFFGSAIG